MFAASGGGLFGFHGSTVGGAVQETGQRRFAPQGSGITGEHEKRSLKRILGVLLISQGATANVQHHRAVTLHKDGESVVVAAARESV
jgi:hypothetical protein